MDSQAPAPPSSAAPRIGDWLSESFTLFGRQWQTWIGQGLIYLVLGPGLMVFGAILFYGMFAAVILGAAASSGGSGSGPPAGALGGMIGGVIGGMVVMVVCLVIGLAFSCHLTGGMLRTAARQLAGEPIRVRDVFGARDVFWPVLGASVLTNLATSVALQFFILPGLLLGGLFSFTLPLIVERRMGVGEAMGKSWEITKPHLWLYLVWFLVIYLIGGIGVSFCILGMAGTYPLCILAQMVAYRDVIGIPGALPSPGTQAAVYVPAGTPPGVSRCATCGWMVAANAAVCPHCQTPLAASSPASPPPTPPLSESPLAPPAAPPSDSKQIPPPGA
jgi:hypothetical protein